MKSRIFRDLRNRTAVLENEVQRQAFRFIARNERLPMNLRYKAQLELNNFPRAARPANVKNRCILTGRGRGILRDFRMCRYQFRLKALRGDLAGVTKSTW